MAASRGQFAGSRLTTDHDERDRIIAEGFAHLGGVLDGGDDDLSPPWRRRYCSASGPNNDERGKATAPRRKIAMYDTAVSSEAAFTSPTTSPLPTPQTAQNVGGAVRAILHLPERVGHIGVSGRHDGEGPCIRGPARRGRRPRGWISSVRQRAVVDLLPQIVMVRCPTQERCAHRDPPIVSPTIRLAHASMPRTIGPITGTRQSTSASGNGCACTTDRRLVERVRAT
jgi:hypothetical protein